ncbi:NAD(P) transhydrogenase subunit beta [Holospora obtusa F1]|uniref:proton-translocating NAD(P)(+) transhydrogenase n=1 Tax=Holospora obtusa F1 TaxID=1399147 RepID=W6TSS7_HOLOB|nr:NAD(P)(+) transhydrogenase (Re/Si-specific) subunit beta [Holospora obtusa]ETZ06827.1 NAD(P) transhydrogenase subunit beta [Holospora obtusa F1]
MSSSFLISLSSVRLLVPEIRKGMVLGSIFGIVTFFPSFRMSLALGLILLAFEMLTSFSRAQYCAWVGKIGMMCAIAPYGAEILSQWYRTPESFEVFPVILFFSAVLGNVLGSIVARYTAMTGLPQLMALFHSLVGLGASCISMVLAHVYLKNLQSVSFCIFFEILLGGIIGAITFTGSLFAVLRLQNIVTHTPSLKVFLSMCCFAVFGTLGSIFWFLNYPSMCALTISMLVSSSFGILMILPVSGSDMPLVVSLLNSCSGWACVSLGIYSNNPLLIIVGAIVGFSGAVLTAVMCKGMNRSLVRVFTGGFCKKKKESSSSEDRVQAISAQEAAFFLKSSERVMVIPGYGAAVAQAQTILQELVMLLKANQCEVHYGIHPVAGRMPGHMDILLAQANVPLEDMLEIGEVNRYLPDTDIALIVGANDTVNPLAEEDASSEIYGMPIFQVYRAKKVLFIKRSMKAGYSGIGNPLYHLPQTYMVFGDGKKVCEDILKAFALL